MLQFMGLQRVEHNWATELNWKQLEKEEQKKNGLRNEIIKIRAEISEIEMKKTKAKINETKS